MKQPTELYQTGGFAERLDRIEKQCAELDKKLDVIVLTLCRILVEVGVNEMGG